MSPPAAIRGTFSDFRLIKGRKCAQIICEIPIEEADTALSVLGGIPQPASERWIALAPLNVTSIKPKEKRRFDDLKAAMQAGIKCGEPVFWKFIQEHYKAPAYDEDGAAKFVRRYCGVKSRSELNLDPNAAKAWGRLAEQFANSGSESLNMRKEFSTKTKALAFQRANGRCEGTKPDGTLCYAKLTVGKCEYDHRNPDGLTGSNDLGNCTVLCRVCHKDKTRKDVADIARAKRREARHIGAHKSKQPFQGWRKFDGSLVFAKDRR